MKVFVLLVLFSVAAFGQGVYSFEQFGAVGNGIADDTAAIQATINAVPDYAQIETVAGKKYKLTATILIQDRQGLKFVGKSGVGSAASGNTNAPQFLWYGPAGGVMTFVNRSRGIVFEGLTWVVKDYFLPNAANVAIDFDMNPLVPGKITTDCLIDRCSIWNSQNPNPDFVGVRIALNSHQNCEFIVIKESNINSSGGTGTGVRIGPSYNAKGIRLEGVAINRCERGVWLITGSLTATSNNHSANKIDYWIDNATEPVVIEKVVSESERFLYDGCSDAPVTLRGNKWEGPTPAGLSPIEFGVSGSMLILEANYFGTPPSGTSFFKPGSNASLISFGNIYNFAQSQAGLGGFPYGTFTFRDNWRGGGSYDYVLGKTKIRGFDENGSLKHVIGRGSDQQTASNYNVVSIDEDKIGTQFGGDVRYFGAQRFLVPTLTTNTTLTNQSPSVMMAEGAITITLPAATAYLPQFKVTSPVFTIKRIGADVVTVNVQNGQLIEGVNTLQLLNDGKTVTLVADGKQWRILSSF